MTEIILSLRPATLCRQDALTYTGLSDAQLCRYEQEGILVFKPVGPNGKRVVPVKQLDALITSIWASDNGQLDEDMDCGDD